MLETFLGEQFFAPRQQDDQTGGAVDTGRTKLMYLVSLALSVFAVVLTWRCNTEAGTSTGLKVLYAVLAFLFPYIYLTYYVIYYYLMKNKCGKKTEMELPQTE